MQHAFFFFLKLAAVRLLLNPLWLTIQLELTLALLGLNSGTESAAVSKGSTKKKVVNWVSPFRGAVKAFTDG